MKDKKALLGEGRESSHFAPRDELGAGAKGGAFDGRETRLEAELTRRFACGGDVGTSGAHRFGDALCSSRGA